MKKKTFGLVAVGAIILLSLGAWAYSSISRSQQAAQTANGDSEIAVVEAKPGNISVKVESPAMVEAFRQLELRSRISGTVVETAEIGDRKSADEVLLRFDGTEQRQQLKIAELDLQQAEVDLRQAQTSRKKTAEELAEKESLFASGSLSLSQIEAARNALDESELAVDAARIKLERSRLNLEMAQENLENTVLRAPFDGVVLRTNVSTGDLVGTGTVLMSFADLSKLRLSAEVDEYDIGKLQLGLPVLITADALGEESLRTRLERISPAAEVINNISIFSVSAVIPSGDGALRPGMSADMSIIVSDDSGLLVPSRAVSSVRGRFYLDVYENEEIVTKRVTVGADDGNNLVVTEGLNEGELVVVPQIEGFSLSGTAAAAGGTSILPINFPGSGGSR
ncbi:MAG TPA: efflux RND transporter periplasmic adaptor subunit [Sediminispirochaeta sp.]|nr:efflux RND transporter periplasmic adaptor subunit [Sediminispirochaeta sp.]